MKRFFVFLILSIVAVLGACSSPETDELVEYHNSYIEKVNPKVQEIDQLLVQSSQATTLENAYKMEKDEVKPLVEEVTQYISNQKPETDVVKELNELRIEQFKTWSDAFDSRLQALEVAINKSENDPEVQNLMQQFEDKLGKAAEIRQEADQKFTEFAKEYNVELTDADESE